MVHRLSQLNPIAAYKNLNKSYFCFPKITKSIAWLINGDVAVLIYLLAGALCPTYRHTDQTLKKKFNFGHTSLFKPV